MIGKISLDASNYDMHSFWIGHANDLFKAGTTVEDIKKFGRWKSNSVYKYLKS